MKSSLFSELAIYSGYILAFARYYSVQTEPSQALSPPLLRARAYPYCKRALAVLRSHLRAVSQISYNSSRA
jgi:hypothetical protein